ncbi:MULTISPECIES: DgsA anti-repressor MtfA [Pantoea]|uniref:DgsA anti-repressor MtfA n=1 Tax=Pantoea TaxID=53335 RepID=UPI002892E647|nr:MULTISPECIES: DgsA anti-repressor MtfA [unclassified Pantoea]MCG7388379.1 DgsA anti-repressor MtfA [Pantoea sp. ACRSB]
MFKWPWKNDNRASFVELPWQQGLAQPVFSWLDEDEQQALIAMAQRFLQQKKLVPLQNVELDELRSARIALLFCLPVLKLGLEWLDGFHDVLIYPEPFEVADSWEDEQGLVHHAAAVHAGQSWTQGPIVLNWLDLQDAFDLSGYNLVIHEVAHKLDARGRGYTSGIPVMALRDVALWEKDLRAAMDEIENEVELVGEQAATIDPYAASDPAECFAVLSEYFFTAPALLYERFPAMYRHLSQFYRQHPLPRLAQNSPHSA